MASLRSATLTKIGVTAAAVGLVAGSYGIAGAATGKAKAGSKASARTSVRAGTAGQPFGPQRSDETPLTGDTLSRATAAALAKVPGGTVVRAETDADGNAKYEVHMTKADGAPVTVYLDDSLSVVKVEAGMPGGPGGPHGAPPAQGASTIAPSNA